MVSFFHNFQYQFPITFRVSLFGSLPYDGFFLFMCLSILSFSDVPTLSLIMTGQNCFNLMASLIISSSVGSGSFYILVCIFPDIYLFRTAKLYQFDKLVLVKLHYGFYGYISFISFIGYLQHSLCPSF